jgi:hypothetical protein
MHSSNPYSNQPERAFWSKAAAAQHITDITGLFDGVPDLPGLKIATAGSCFARHIGKFLKSRGLQYLDYESAPSFLSTAEAEHYGYGIFSCRYGNIYTARQLRQLFDEAFGRRQPQDAVWKKDGRYYDALRPRAEPRGFGSLEELAALRAAHLVHVRAMFTNLDLFVFTLGLTEAWISNRDDTVYPIAPGVIAGEYQPEACRFHNFRYSDVHADMVYFVEALRSVNPNARVLLTISPVSLAATATDQHVLVATTYSKSVLRSVAGDLASDIPGVFYFPSYEIITGAPARQMFYNPDLRTVCEAGVATVMQHFFSGSPSPEGQLATSLVPETLRGFEHCEEAHLDLTK